MRDSPLIFFPSFIFLISLDLSPSVCMYEEEKTRFTLIPIHGKLTFSR